MCERAIAIAPPIPPIIPGRPLTLWIPKVSKIFQCLSNHPVKYYIPSTQTIPEIAPKIMHPAGLTNKPVLDPAPIEPHKDPLNKSITENFPFMKTLIAKDAKTLAHIAKIVFIITTDF